jgi:hypothetical protein
LSSWQRYCAWREFHPIHDNAALKQMRPNRRLMSMRVLIALVVQTSL